MTAALGPGGQPLALGGSPGGPAARTAPALFPQSTGDDGLARLQAAWARPHRFGFFTEVNNTHIGVLYIATGLLFFLGAGVLALLMRIQLAWPGNTFLDAATYNQFFTMHGTVMMFLFAVPIVEAVAVLLLPEHARHAGHALPPPVVLRVLVLRHRRRAGLLQPVLRHRAGRRLVHVSALDRRRGSRPGSTPTSGCSGSGSSRSPPSPPRSN